jgi:nucleotide-binding universal stress UspA family protein
MYTKILVPIDPSEPSSWAKAMPVAAALRKLWNTQLILTTVVTSREAMIEAQWTQIGFEELIESARSMLLPIRDEFPEAADARIEIGGGTIWREIVSLARREAVDLIVLASHRPAMKDYLIGANAAAVARHAPCSVLIVRE